jgi:hypothetical protein
MKHAGGDGSPLKLPITSIGMSTLFTSQALANGYSTLEDFRELTLAGLLGIEWMTSELALEVIAKLREIHRLVRL